VKLSSSPLKSSIGLAFWYPSFLLTAFRSLSIRTFSLQAEGVTPCSYRKNGLWSAVMGRRESFELAYVTIYAHGEVAASEYS